MSNNKENPSEKVFSNLCAKQYLKGFVFHSPKYNDPTEKEAGDIVLWLRTSLIVFEVFWRDPSLKGSTKNFIKRIGEKRKQLEADFDAYKSKGSKISLTNEDGNIINFRQDFFHPDNFVGVIIVDCETDLEKIHYESYKKTLNGKFPICVITKKDFVDLLVEIDTVSDLLYYLKDRHDFVKSIFERCPNPFIDLNRRTERDIVALYKRKGNSFQEYNCNHLSNENIWSSYRNDFSDRIKLRDDENKRTKIIDVLTDYLLKDSTNDDLTLEFSWEIGVTTRRQRVYIAEKIEGAFQGLKNGIETRQFAFLNPTTGCWSVFYFENGNDSGLFKDNISEMTRLKLFKEIRENSFEHSIFGYGFFKSSKSHEDDLYSEIGLWVEDAHNYQYPIPEEDYTKALKYFGKPDSLKIEEFPENKI